MSDNLSEDPDTVAPFPMILLLGAIHWVRSGTLRTLGRITVQVKTWMEPAVDSPTDSIITAGALGTENT